MARSTEFAAEQLPNHRKRALGASPQCDTAPLVRADNRDNLPTSTAGGRAILPSETDVGLVSINVYKSPYLL
jgi:hypothetical protein